MFSSGIMVLSDITVV